jgi:hypothetical protein
MTNKELTLEEQEEQNAELNYAHLVYDMSKSQLRIEAIAQREKALKLQKEIEIMKFLMADASEDLVYVPTAKRLIREHNTKQRI